MALFDSENWIDAPFWVSVTLIPYPSCVEPNEAPVRGYIEKIRIVDSYLKIKRKRIMNWCIFLHRKKVLLLRGIAITAKIILESVHVLIVFWMKTF